MSKNKKKRGLDQYGTECFGRVIFATIREKCGTERVQQVQLSQHSSDCSCKCLTNTMQTTDCHIQSNFLTLVKHHNCHIHDYVTLKRVWCVHISK